MKRITTMNDAFEFLDGLERERIETEQKARKERDENLRPKIAFVRAALAGDQSFRDVGGFGGIGYEGYRFEVGGQHGAVLIEVVTNTTCYTVSRSGELFVQAYGGVDGDCERLRIAVAAAKRCPTWMDAVAAIDEFLNRRAEAAQRRAGS